jgi:hypothetical protein
MGEGLGVRGQQVNNLDRSVNFVGSKWKITSNLDL